MRNARGYYTWEMSIYVSDIHHISSYEVHQSFDCPLKVWEKVKLGRMVVGENSMVRIIFENYQQMNVNDDHKAKLWIESVMFQPPPDLSGYDSNIPPPVTKVDEPLEPAITR